MNAKYFVPFDTAKQLKEKGYPQDIDYIYDTGGVRHWRHLTLYQMDKLNLVAAPTYHEVVDWLERKWICVSAMNRPWGVWFASVEEKYKPIENGYDTDDYTTREEALNVAILVALSMI